MLIRGPFATANRVSPSGNQSFNVLWQVKGQLVKLGIESPMLVKVIRGGASGADGNCSGGCRRNCSRGGARLCVLERLSHQTRNELNLLQLRLQMLQLQVDRGETIHAENSTSPLAKFSRTGP